MADLRTATALSLMCRTAPVIVLRRVGGTGIALACVLVTGTGARLGPDGRLAGRAVADGQGRIPLPRNRVVHRFDSANVLSGLDRLVNHTITSVTRLPQVHVEVTAGPASDPSWTARRGTASDDTFRTPGRRAVAVPCPHPTTGGPA